MLDNWFRFSDADILHERVRRTYVLVTGKDNKPTAVVFYL